MSPSGQKILRLSAQDDTHCVGHCPAVVHFQNMVILSESEESSHRNLQIVKNRAGQGNNELHRTLHELSAANVPVGAKDPSPSGSG